MDSPDSVHGPINLGNPEEYQVLELAQQVLELTGSRSKLQFQELPQDDPVRRCPDPASCCSGTPGSAWKRG